MRAWNSLVETVIREPRRAAGLVAGGLGAAAAAASPLRPSLSRDVPRRPFGIGELDRVLGGGIVVGSIVLVGGEPGIGKSTLLLQAPPARARLARPPCSTRRARSRPPRSGSGQIASACSAGRPGRDPRRGRDGGRADRGARRAERPTLVIVDSIQTSTVDDLDGPAGSVGQVRESALRLAELAKSESIAVVLVGHVTKDGSLAGPKTLEHLVDAVLALEGERFSPLRIVRASKNRFGSTEEVGVFEMGPSGLAELDDPARAFLSAGGRATAPAPGSVVAPTLEGSRPILVEVQALVAAGAVGTPRRTASGVDPNRVALLIAVLGRRAGIGLASHDVYVNIAGGLTVEEPALDLPIALALASSLRDRPVAGGNRRDRRGGSARRAAAGPRGRAAAAGGGPPRLHAGDRAAAAAAARPEPASAGATGAAEVVVVRDTLREAVEAALGPAAGRVAAAPARC